MSLSLKDQLIAAGFVKKSPDKPAPNVAKKAPPSAQPPHQSKASVHHKSKLEVSPKRTQSEPTLESLYQARAKAEAAEAAERKRQAQAKEREAAERKRAVRALIDGKDLQQKDAEIARHFEYGRKIRRIYLHARQREDLNAGRLGVVQFEGKFYLLDAAIVEQVKSIAPQFVALLGASEELSSAAIEGYQDPRFQVPDDLMW
jgi:uncharacterized protein YaiL (DUF2058 family)